MPSFGNLFASLTLESGSFMSGIKAAQKEIRETQKHFSKIGGQIQKAGAIMSAGITAPVIGAGAAIAGMARGMAENIPELQRMATTAGTSVAELQRMAFAAKTVGIEQDKLGDILKDTQDKIGDFIANGGGEMQDFFKNVAPKVGITAEAFRNLSGPQALQLYYTSLQKAGLSQAEQVNYMESIADEASGLIPLLRDGGKAFDELGRGAATLTPQQVEQLKKYQQASDKMAESFRKLTISIVDSGLLDIFTRIATKIAEVVSEFAKANPELFRVTAVVGGIAAVFGPAVLAIGSMVTAVAAFLPYLPAIRAGLLAVRVAMLGVFANPVVLGAAVVIGGIYLAWKNWDKIEPIVRNLYVGVKTWIVDKLGAVWNWLHGKIEAVKGWFFGMYDAVVGHSYVPDMVDEIGQHMTRLDSLMVAPARKATSEATQVFQQLQQRVAGLLDRLFPEQARFAQFKRDMDDLAAYAAKVGMTPEALREAQRRLAKDAYGDNAPPSVLAEGAQVDILKDVKSLPDQIKDEWGRVEAANDNLGDSFATMSRNVTSSLQGLVNSIRSGDWLSSLQGVIDLIAQLGSTGIFGKSFAASMASFRTFGGGRAIGGPVMPNTDYLVGERGPEILRMGRQGGSIVPNDQIGGGGGQLVIRLSPELEADWLQKSAGQSVQILQAAAPGMLSTASAKARRDAARPVTPGGRVG